MRIDQCRDVVEVATAFLEDSLPRDEAVQVRTHLAECTGCTTYLAQLRTTVNELGRLEGDDLPDDVRSALLQAWRRSHQS